MFAASFLLNVALSIIAGLMIEALVRFELSKPKPYQGKNGPPPETLLCDRCLQGLVVLPGEKRGVQIRGPCDKCNRTTIVHRLLRVPATPRPIRPPAPQGSDGRSLLRP